MYRQKVFDVPDVTAMHDIIERRAAGYVVSMCAGEIVASLLPLLLDRDRGELGTLVGHFARANEQWRQIDAGVDALVIFSGPDAYVSPDWYASKHESGKAVPTWNYVSVHAHGPLVIHDDKPFVEGVVRRLTHRHESVRPTPWAVDDAPADYIDSMLGAIVGVEIPISKLEGKRKLSQNRPATDIPGVIAGLAAADPTSRAVAALMSDLA